MYTPNQVADYIIFRLTSDEPSQLSNLKLQKLLYYTQAWYLAFTGNTLFKGDFQAWVHGPVNREVYNRFKSTKYLYSSIVAQDIEDKHISSTIDEQTALHINSVLESYAGYSDTQLEGMTHAEDPWIAARKGYRDIQRCEVVIDEKLMETYYRKRLN